MEIPTGRLGVAIISISYTYNCVDWIVTVFVLAPARMTREGKLQALVYDILPLEEGAGKRCGQARRGGGRGEGGGRWGGGGRQVYASSLCAIHR